MWKTGNIITSGTVPPGYGTGTNVRNFMGIREFYGGDLQGVLDKMDYLEDLGVEVIYFNPSLCRHPIISMIFRIMIILTRITGKSLKTAREIPFQTWDNDNTHASKYINRVTDTEN